MNYQFDSRIRYSESGEDKKLTLPAMIDYFQDCTTFQSEDLGVGLDFATERNRAWIISYWHIDIHRRPQFGEKVKVVTAPYEIKGFFGRRNFWMEDEEGQMLACADSYWVFLNTKTGRPVAADPEFVDCYGKGERLEMEELSRKIPMPKENAQEEAFQVMRSHIDTNHHVNNAQYISMAQQYLPQEAVVTRLRVEYKRSALLHDTIVPYVNKTENLITVSLCDGEKKPYAILEFQIEKE